MGVALVALVVAASGGAYAAVKSSPSTISACVHHKGGGLYVAHKCARHDARLRWDVTGPTGRQGEQGVMGLQGPAGQPGGQHGAGIQGPPGPFVATLPSGKTLTGDYRTSSAGGVFVGDTQSFAFPLASKPSVHFVGIGATPPAQCPGTASSPKAAPGNLCLYATEGSVSATAVDISNPETNEGPDASPRGFSACDVRLRHVQHRELGGNRAVSPAGHGRGSRNQPTDVEEKAADEDRLSVSIEA